MRYITAIPAYGRDYNSAREVADDWEAGKDFLIRDPFASGYVNKDDKPDDVILVVRYKSLRNITVIRE